MIAFKVDDMSCGHCVQAITQAVQQADAGAQVQIDLAQHRVTIQPVRLHAEQLQAVIREAGYTPVPLPIL